ncbi:Ankyrin repeat domain-containing protein 29, partial [Geodia barretti]
MFQTGSKPHFILSHCTGWCQSTLCASQDGHSDVVDILLEAGADVHQATTENGDVPLGIAAQNGHTETVQRLLEAGANVNHQNKDGASPLYVASQEGHTEVV